MQVEEGFVMMMGWIYIVLCGLLKHIPPGKQISNIQCQKIILTLFTSYWDYVHIQQLILEELAHNQRQDQSSI